MKIKEISKQIAQIIKERSLFDPTTKKMITSKTLEPYMDQKLKDKLIKQNIKNISVYDTSINLTMNYNYAFTKLKEMVCNIYDKENYKLKYNDIKDILINYGKYNNEVFYRIFIVKTDHTHTKSIRLNKKDVKEIKHFYPEIMNLFTEDMAQFDEYTSQSLQIRTDVNLTTFKDYETLPNILNNMNEKE